MMQHIVSRQRERGNLVRLAVALCIVWAKLQLRDAEEYAWTAAKMSLSPGAKDSNSFRENPRAVELEIGRVARAAADSEPTFVHDDVNMDAVYAEFDRACGENPLYPKWDICFPEAQSVVAALQRSTTDFTSDEFLYNLHTVYHQFHSWPPAWSGISVLLDPRHPWTAAYCDRVVGSQMWSPFDYFSVNLKALRPLLRFTLGEIKEQTEIGHGVLNRYFAGLLESEDAKTRQLVLEFFAQDKINQRERMTRIGPLEHLLEHELSKATQHILTVACAGTRKARLLLDAKNTVGETLLHQAARDGNAALADVLLNAVPTEERGQYVGILNKNGYSAQDLARSAGFSAVDEIIRKLGGCAKSGVPHEPAKLFPAVQESMSVKPLVDAPTGGWSVSDAGVVPSEWLASDGGCPDVDVIHVTQFDWTVFEQHYARPLRPLLIRGGANIDARVARHYTREGLLAAAGHRTVRAFDFPYADQLSFKEPTEQQIDEYVKYLEDRLARDPRKELSYVFVNVKDEDDPLKFAYAMPDLLKGRVQRRQTQFYVGGVLMGTPMHYHIDAANSLMYGRKLWLLMPPAEKEFRKTVFYDDLVRSNGAQGVPRCVQEAGDLLYVPSGWNHAAICLSDCVGVAHEFNLVTSA